MDGTVQCDRLRSAPVRFHIYTHRCIFVYKRHRCVFYSIKIRFQFVLLYSFQILFLDFN